MSNTGTRHESNVPSGFVDDLFRLDGKIAIVTGGASGLGEAIAHGLRQAGAQVVIADVNEDSARAVAESVADEERPPVALRVDVTSRESIDALVQEAVGRYGRIDVLVNSAGTASRHPAEDFPEDVWDRIITLNLKGTFMTCQAVGRQMLAQGSGSIINIASIGASIAYPYTTAYLQSKGGVVQLTRSLALEWIDRGVRVNAIAPSLFDTPLVRANDAQRSVTSEFIMARTPIGRRGQPHEVVGPAIFLASAASSMVVGHVLQVDGGYLIN
jgi:NAD(P)-dependent dehydrogenase (short-subunit alcohol dehydrogenase family)